MLGDPEAPYPVEREPTVGDILHLPTGIYVDQVALFTHSHRARVVFVGETHDNPASHRLQEQILAALQRQNPGRVSLAMEMFTPVQQPILDRWTAGELTEKEFLKQVDWFQNWRMNFAYYRALLNFCRDNRIPVVALNADKELQQKLGRTPLDQLAAEDRERLPEMDMDDPYQQAMVKAVFSDHAMGGGMLDGFHRVQTLWEEAMAANLADYLRTQDKEHQVMVIAGGNHVRYGFGIPRRLFRRLPVSYLLVGSQEINIPEDKQDRLMDIPDPNYPMPPYDFMVFTEYEDLPAAGVKLGIMLATGKDGLLIKKVLADSIAEQNDLRADDQLMRINGQPLAAPFDLIYELQQTQAGDSIVLELSRQDQELRKAISFPAEQD
jgi:uncharacterized iron-regulated protein